ncbi:MAG: zeta toxin family protein [bacterium]
MIIGKEEEIIAKKAVKFINKNKEMIIVRFADLSDFIPDEFPITIFMAGSPGAGKTEFSKDLVEAFKNRPVRIDADDLREIFEEYNGANAHVFQKAVSIGVDILYRHCLKNNLNVVLDGTFAHRRVEENIQRSLDLERSVEIYFVYQKPKIAWNFTQKREMVEHRRITKEAFIKTFLGARDNVNMVKRRFGDRIMLNLLIKDITNLRVKKKFIDIKREEVDSYLGRIYNYQHLNKMIK